jgi:carotenoid cleavage dioxygenase-like enzyme
MGYHFDGLAAVATFEFHDNNTVSYLRRRFASKLEQDYDECIFYGSGTGPTPGTELCTLNPVVNLLPVHGQLWLTIDTSAWGRMDPDTLATLESSRANVTTISLNAHPACDPVVGARAPPPGEGKCFVQHPCTSTAIHGPVTNEVCVSELVEDTTTPDGDISLLLRSSANLSHDLTIQHSHSPCVTPHFVVSKLDSFETRNPIGSSKPPPGAAGVLKTMRQHEDTAWLVMDRRTNASRVLQSDFSFVNNHFCNCFEDPSTGDVVVDAIAATSQYLDTYFESRLGSGAATDWASILLPPQRCVVPTASASSGGDVTIHCTDLFAAGAAGAELRLDYPAFNPIAKMDPDYKYWCARVCEVLLAVQLPRLA